MSIHPSSSCIRDCSLLNQTTCQPMKPRRVVLDQEDVDAHIWSPDGCYNSSLFKDTDEYLKYEQVSRINISFYQGA